MIRACIFTLLLLIILPASGQRARVGLCLSGGGAKGLAHIGLLKVIDSAGVKIDYITGTSMGAIIGGMYAIGYSGNELEKIVRAISWEMVVSNHLPLTDINVEEKDEFDRYLAELPMQGMRPGLPLGVIEGQALNKLLGELTFPVHQITHFDSLPIPFRCVGADILTGEAVVLKEGYLPTVMRASMAIPSVFTPVKIKNHLLVDGGLVRNFPVTDVKEMGADIVIGGYTGGRLFTEEELNTAIKLLYQSASFNRVADSEMQKSLCTILADYDQQLQDYSTASFKSIDSIVDIGYRVALKLYPRLKHLADSLKMAVPKDSVKRATAFASKVCITKISLVGASRESEALVMGKLGLQVNEAYSVDEINQGINNVFGTRFFDKVYYTLDIAPDGNGLVIHLQESRRATFKFALHYDNEQAAGILANLTLRNVLGEGSRILATLDVSEYPKARLNYQKFINKKQDIWVATGYTYEFIPYRLYNVGRLQEELTNSYNNFYAGLNQTLGKNSYIGLYANNEWSFTRTKIYPEDRSTPDSFSFRNLRASEKAVTFRYFHNSLNSFLFPTQGKKLLAQVKFVPQHTNTNNYYISDNTAVGRRMDVTTTVTPALKFSAAFSHFKPLSPQLTLVNSFFGGLIMDIRLKGHPRDLYSDAALPGLFFAGGVEQRQRDNLVPFLGYRETELIGAQVLAFHSGLQIEPINRLFITPTVSFLASGGELGPFLQNITHWSFAYQDYSKGVNHAAGYGITFAYNWFGGPLSFTVYKATGVAVTRGYFTFGFKF